MENWKNSSLAAQDRAEHLLPNVQRRERPSTRALRSAGQCAASLSGFTATVTPISCRHGPNLVLSQSDCRIRSGAACSGLLDDIRRDGTGELRPLGDTPSGLGEIGPFDRVIVATGQHPDLWLTRELRLELIPGWKACGCLVPTDRQTLLRRSSANQHAACCADDAAAKAAGNEGCGCGQPNNRAAPSRSCCGH